MATPDVRIDQIGGPSGAVAATLLRPVPAPPLRVFISYKWKDHDATTAIKQMIQKLGGNNVDVFVSGDEPAGIQWRENVLKGLRNAHMLIFLYTDPKSHWDWCLYETGYFDARQDPNELSRRLYVLHGRGDAPSGPFLGLNTVPIDASDAQGDVELKAFLATLFVHSTQPSVNPHWDTGSSSEIVAAFAAPFRRREEVAPPREYVRRLTFRLLKSAATVRELERGRIPADAMVSGDENSFRLFGLGTEVTRKWSLLEESWHRKSPPAPGGSVSPDPATVWIENAAQKMLAAIRGEDFDDGLPLLFSHFAKTRDEALYRPSLARLATYSDAYEFDIIFVDLPPQFVAQSQGPLTTVASLLRLAYMFRFGWIEPTAQDFVRRPPGEIPEITKDMWRRLSSVTAESFNQGLRTEQAVLLAFENSPLQRDVKESMEEWTTKVAPLLDDALKKADTAAINEALTAASRINWRFHRACAQRYYEIVKDYEQQAIGPSRQV